MKSRTSSCKKTALRKDFSRFWPVWVGYVLCLIVIQAVQSNSDLEYWYAANMAQCIGIMGVVNCGYALIVAQMLFGDLFNARLCNGLHSLPLKREQWFGVHVKAGFLFSLIPTALMIPLSETIIHLYSGMIRGWQIPILWFADANIQYIFFFGLAVFCVMCAGSRFGSVILYGIVNFASLLLYAMADLIYTPLMYGVVTQSAVFVLLSPIYHIAELRFVDAQRLKDAGTYIDEFGIEQQKIIGEFEIQYENWVYILVLAAIGIVLLMLARKMYRQRKLECAGDLLAVRWLEPVFQVSFSVLCMAGFYAVYAVFFGWSSNTHYLLLAIGLVAGWFAGRMFLERSTRVFRFRNFAGLALLTLALGATLMTAKADTFGIAAWVPQQQEVKKATISLSHNTHFTTEDPAEIADVIRLHEAALVEHTTVHPDYSDELYNPYAEDVAAYVSVQYHLDNGTIAQREYYILPEGEAGIIAREYCSRLTCVVSRESVKNEADFRHELSQAHYVAVSGHIVADEYITDEFRQALADAIIADCENQSIVQSAVYHPVPLLETEESGYSLQSVYLDIQCGDFWLYLNVYSDCENILAVLEPTGTLEQMRQEHISRYGE